MSGEPLPAFIRCLIIRPSLIRNRNRPPRRTAPTIDNQALREGCVMPYLPAIRLGLVPGLLLCALFFSATASLRQKSDDSSPGTAPAMTPPAEDVDLAEDGRVVVNADLISFNVTVTDKAGRRIDGLPQTALSVFDEKQKHEISFVGEDHSPVSVGVVFDLTGWMTEKKVRRAREAIARFMETSHK